MISRKEEERNEKIIRGLMKLPPNRRCINCDSLGPQYVCTNFWTFVCITCSGIHREFTHRVKSVSMSKFTTQEVKALESGGNQRAREAFLKDWDMQNKRFPSNSNPDRIREFIKDVYVDKKYARGMSSSKPPKDAQNQRNFDEDRRASSYHSFSQSPPYDHQYEERFYGKPSGIQARRTGSERLSYDGRLPSVVHSPGHMGDHFNEERFANEGSGTRYSDFSASSAGETVRYDVQSPNSQKGTGYSSPHSQVVRDILIEDGNVKKDTIKSQNHLRPTSSNSFGSSNSISVKSVSSSSLSEQSSGIQMIEGTPPSFLPQSSAQKVTQQQDCFSLPSVEHSVTKSTPQLIDLFAEVNQTLPTTSSTHNTDHVPFPEDKGWATFDVPQHSLSTVEQTSTSHITDSRDQTSGVNANAHSTGSDISNWLPAQSSVENKGSDISNWLPAQSSVENKGSDISNWLPAQSSVENNHVTSVTAHWSLDSHKATTSFTPSSTEFLSAFEHSSGNSNRTIESLALKTNSEVFAREPPALVNPFSSLNLPEGSIKFDFHAMTVGGDTSVHNMPFGYDVEPGIPFPSLPLNEERTLELKSTNPFDFPYEADLGNGRTLDMSSLQAALPNPQYQIPFQNSIPQPRYLENHMPSYVSPLPDGLPYMTAQQPNPQLTTLTSQSYVGPSKGNPFA